MVLTVTPVADPKTGAQDIEQTSLTSTKEAPVTGTKDIIWMEIDNSANAAASFVKIWDTAVGSVTVGTTDPDYVFKVPASKKIQTVFQGDRIELATSLTWACVTAGGTGGTTSPTSAVIVRATVIDG